MDDLDCYKYTLQHQINLINIKLASIDLTNIKVLAIVSIKHLNKNIN